MAQSSKESLKFIINHVVLPPKLPQEAEDPRVLRDAEQQLFQLLLSQVDSFRAKDSQHTVSPLAETSKLWDVIKTMLSRCAALNAAQFLSVNLLSDMLANLKEAGT